MPCPTAICLHGVLWHMLHCAMLCCMGSALLSALFAVAATLGYVILFSPPCCIVPCYNMLGHAAQQYTSFDWTMPGWLCWIMSDKASLLDVVAQAVSVQ